MTNDPTSNGPTGTSIASLVGARAGAADGLDLFLRQLVGSTDPSNLEAAPAEALAREALMAFRAIGEKPRGTHSVSSRPSEVITDGVAIEIVNDDMPFLVDSVLGELQSRAIEVALVLHPIYKATRDDAGRLLAVTAAGDGHWDDGRQESYISVHLSGLSPARQEELCAAIASILGDVRVVVEDWAPMVARLRREVDELAQTSAALPEAVRAEALAFLDWLARGSFTFLGMRDYNFLGDSETGELGTDDTAGLGLLRDPEMHVLRRGNELVALTPEVRQFFFSPDPLIITKANVVSRVHRRVHMDYVGVKRYGPNGDVVGELRIVGLFTATAYTQSPTQIPVLRRKIAAAEAALALPPESHAGKSLANVIETFPRDELFQIAGGDLERWAAAILDLELRPRVRVLLRYDRFDRFVSALVYVPRDRFSTSVRERIGQFLAERFGGYIAAFYPHFRDGPLVRVHFIVARRTGPIPVQDARGLEQGVQAIVRTWADELKAAIGSLGADAQPLAGRYLRAFPAGYTEAHSPARALEDMARMERLGPERPAAIDIYREAGASDDRLRAAIYCLDEPIRLSARVPLLENLGFAVIDERTWRLMPRFDDRPRPVLLHDMALASFDGRPLEPEASLDTRLEETFTAVLSGEAEDDSFNKLVLVAGLTWREAAVLRAYSAYLRQLGSAFGPRYVAQTLARHPAIVTALVKRFHTRFDPDRLPSPEARRAEEAQIDGKLESLLAEVESLDEDRIIRAILQLLGATLRTNFYQRDGDGRPVKTLAFKLDGQAVALAPRPRPYREIFVAGPLVEGVHLRFAPIARGGIRWSDRAQDYRTEVLGLAKAQQVKNAVIVPAGAKGGFFPKTLTPGGTRDEIQQQGVRAYRTFIEAMLDLTDNLVEGAIAAPQRVVRHDGDDPYLVVAADKGTATFSDIANGIALEHGFWLGDAFASGGSEGYDHKKMGITARGAWECVKRHFREIDIDIQTTPFRVVGVGDMSGDVFGNGMLMSPCIQLVAAFDHRHIFLDPMPDPDASFAERKRLIELPRSSWGDYDTAKISAGGGVFSRQAKSIMLSPEVRAMLGLADEEATPSDILRAILAAKTDLLWFGGIGTYVRASTESNADAGDRSNDGIRIAASELGCVVIGEGANLGMTQAARIEAARRGIRLNTDFIDNSAGVNTSDQEVNIKIALGPAVRSGRLGAVERSDLLVGMTDDVAAAVLRNNYQQSLAISLAQTTGGRDVGAWGRLMRWLEQREQIDRQLDGLPSDAELADRSRQGTGLTRPEIAVLLSHAKIALLKDLLESPVPDESYFNSLFTHYFPPALSTGFSAEIAEHRLRREIVATTVTNGVVNRLGPAGALLVADATGRPIADVAFGFVAAREMLDLPHIWQSIDALDGRIPGRLQLDLYAAAQAALVVAVARLMGFGIAAQPLDQTVDRLVAAAQAVRGGLSTDLPAATRARMEADGDKLRASGVPDALAADLSRLPLLAATPDILAISAQGRAVIDEAARAYLDVAGHLRIDEIVSRAQALAPADDYERLAIGGGVASLGDAHRRLAIALMAARRGHPMPVGVWLAQCGPLADRARGDLEAIAAGHDMSVARLAVASARLGGLAQAFGGSAGD